MGAGSSAKGRLDFRERAILREGEVARVPIAGGDDGYVIRFAIVECLFDACKVALVDMGDLGLDGGTWTLAEVPRGRCRHREVWPSLVKVKLRPASVAGGNGGYVIGAILVEGFADAFHIVLPGLGLDGALHIRREIRSVVCVGAEKRPVPGDREIRFAAVA